MSSNYDGLTRNIWSGTWSAEGDYPIVLDTEVRGTLQSISGDLGDRLIDISGQRLTDGMLVYIKNGYTDGAITRDSDSYYKYILLAGEQRDPVTGYMPNAEDNWVKLTFSGGSGTGASGYSGISGYSGASGYSGVTGADGASGYSGVTGADGASGYSGISGISGYSGDTGPAGTSGFSGYSGQSFSGDYVASLIAGTGVTIDNPSGSGSTPTVSIGQAVAPSDTVTFGNVVIAAGGSLSFEDDAIKAALIGAIPYTQITAAGKMYTNADALLGLTINDMKPGDFYYDDVNASMYLCYDTGLGYYDLLDITVRA